MQTSRSIILAGFKEDCEKLMFRFEQANDIRFGTFSEIWRDMKFSLVFTGRPRILELLEFCEEALDLCKQFLLLRTHFNERIGGLYLLYGVYYKMPVDQFKIRVKLEDWKSIMELHSEIKEAEHLDANYIMCKMIADNAFHYCIFDKEFGLEKPFRVKDKPCFNPYSVLPAMKDLFSENQLLAEIDELSKLYKRKKDTISAVQSIVSLNLYNETFAEEIVSDIKDFEKQRKNKQQTDGIFENKKDTEVSTSKEDKSKSEKKIIKKNARSRLGDAFDSESCESEDTMSELSDCDPNLAASFD